MPKPIDKAHSALTRALMATEDPDTIQDIREAIDHIWKHTEAYAKLELELEESEK